MSAGVPQGVATPPVSGRAGRVAATIGAVVAVVILVVLALVSGLLGVSLIMATDSCGTGTTGDLLICSSGGQMVVVGAPGGGAVLGVLVALAGFIPFRLRYRRLILISAGYVIVLGGFGLAFLVAFSGW